MKVWELFINCLQNTHINWENAIVTLLAAFFGAWFAYRFNLRQQRKWDKERKIEEEKIKQEEQLLQLNYLQTYLHSYLEEFYDIYQKLNYKQQLYKSLIKKNYQATKEDLDNIYIAFIDFSSQFRDNWEKLSFIYNNSEFISSLARVETAIHRFVFSHDKEIEQFGADVKNLRQQLEKIPTKKFILLRDFIDKQKYNNGEEIYRLQQAVVCLDTMLNVFEKYVISHNLKLDKLSYSSKIRKFVNQAQREVNQYEA
ncbi:hypothetical protein [Candidatus Avelusimicrobium alvi]|uniref:hypothetical protein n=1 Tax=Candidatus Avelusimicrobium alvi TaxID=3416221 RepID=UPI003D125151